MIWMAMIGSAMALDCADFDFQASLPADGATEQPLNTRVVLFVYAWHDPGTVLLHDSDGEQVDVSAELVEAGTDAQWIITPSEPLSPGATYTVSLERGDELAAEVHFTTGHDLDHEPPTGPAVVNTDSDTTSDEWGDWSYFSVDLDAPDEDVFYEVTLERPDGTVAVRNHPVAGIQFNDDPCSDDEVGTWDAADTWVSVVAVDAAGNRSDAAYGGGPTLICGTGACSATASSSGLLAGMLSMFAIGWRRSRR